MLGIGYPPLILTDKPQSFRFICGGGRNESSTQEFVERSFLVSSTEFTRAALETVRQKHPRLSHAEASVKCPRVQCRVLHKCMKICFRPAVH